MVEVGEVHPRSMMSARMAVAVAGHYLRKATMAPVVVVAVPRRHSAEAVVPTRRQVEATVL